MKSQEKTGIIFFPAFDWAMSPSHPEREERLLYTRDQLQEEGFLDLPIIREYGAEMAEIKDILRVHFCIPGHENIVTIPHKIAAGACLALGDALMKKEVANVFSLVRPPGHHAMLVTYDNRGFCNINNEAIMVEYLRKKYGVRKVAIVDSDVHHGDGTQDIFYHDPDVLFISFHQDGRTLYPGSGFVEEAGGVNAYGKTINIPLPPGTGDAEIHMVLDQLILPILEEFQPELIINSAGQDNHFTDPLANMKFTAQGYGKLTEKLKPDIVVLEGGYAVESALPYVNMAVILALTGQDYSRVQEPGLEKFRLTESSDIPASIPALIQQVWQVWEDGKHYDKDALFGPGKYQTRRKSIFYDTHYLREVQLEKVRKCDKCPGWIGIESWLAEGAYDKTSYCISLPLYACEDCRREAREEEETVRKTGKFHNVYYQDRREDLFLLNGKEIIG